MKLAELREAARNTIRFRQMSYRTENWQFVFPASKPGPCPRTGAIRRHHIHSSAVGSVPYRAILKGRRAEACELSPRYFMDAAHYLQAAEREMSMPTLFDLEEMDREAA